MFALRHVRPVVAKAIAIRNNGLKQAIRCMSVVNLSDNEAVEKFLVMNSKVILWYTATWCGPCQQIKPMVEELAKKYSGEVSFGKIDVDDNPEAAQEAKVASVPTFIAYVDEELLVRFAGADTKQLQEVAAQIQKHE